MKLASWNVNSLKIRLDQVMDWLAKSQIDVLALQEIKLPDDQFPVQAFKETGFSVLFSGQKSYNGVAILSRMPMEDILTDIPGFEDPQRRILAVTLVHPTIGPIRFINLYVPNGSEVFSQKYHYKLSWLEHVTAYIKHEMERFPYLAVVGDFNIAPDDRDVHDPIAWQGMVHVSELERQAFAKIIQLGLHDSFRTIQPEAKLFSWWDYRAARFRRNHGLRIDHILLSEALNQYCIDAGIDKEPRKAERPSDHAPVWSLINLQ